MANGPVDAGTMLQMQGAIAKERGFARMWSAGASPTVQAAYQQSAANKGALAAENIRNRYFKKEFEKVLETRVNPILDRLKEAQELRAQALETTVMPVEHAIDEQEAQERINASTELALPKIQPVKGGKDNQKEQMLPVPQEVPPNPAIGQQMGATTTKEELALLDPASGTPVPLSSPRGVNIIQKADLDFWKEYTNVNQELMQVMSEYTGNPYADKYAEKLIDLTIKQSNIATTGKADPQAAQEWMEARQRFDTEQEIYQQNVAAGQLALETKEAGLNVSVREAAQLAATDSNFVGLLGNKIQSKLQSGKPLTRNEKLEASSAVRTYRDLQEKQIADRARQRVFTISPTNLVNPGNWQGEMRTKDPVFKQYYGEAYADLVNNQQISVAQMSPEERESVLRANGASSTDIALFEEGETMSPGLNAAFERMANSKQASMTANDMAELRRLPELEKQQPELSPVIDQTIEDAIMQIKAKGLVPNEELLRADRYRTFFEVTHGREAPAVHDVSTRNEVNRVLESQERQRYSQPSRTQLEPLDRELPKISEKIKEITGEPGSPRERFRQALESYEAQLPESVKEEKSIRAKKLEAVRRRKERLRRINRQPVRKPQSFW